MGRLGRPSYHVFIATWHPLTASWPLLPRQGSRGMHTWLTAARCQNQAAGVTEPPHGEVRNGRHLGKAAGVVLVHAAVAVVEGGGRLSACDPSMRM